MTGVHHGAMGRGVLKGQECFAVVVERVLISLLFEHVPVGGVGGEVVGCTFSITNSVKTALSACVRVPL